MADDKEEGLLVLGGRAHVRLLPSKRRHLGRCGRLPQHGPTVRGERHVRGRLPRRHHHRLVSRCPGPRHARGHCCFRTRVPPRQSATRRIKTVGTHQRRWTSYPSVQGPNRYPGSQARISSYPGFPQHESCWFLRERYGHGSDHKHIAPLSPAAPRWPSACARTPTPSSSA